jgi:hypothetical protein
LGQVTIEVGDGATITLDADGDELVVRWRNPGAPGPTEAEPEPAMV